MLDIPPLVKVLKKNFKRMEQFFIQQSIRRKQRVKSKNMEEAILKTMKIIKGAYSLVVI